MGRRRKPDESPMSFFSFQDIVACTTGIMVLVTLLLTMELLQRALGAPADDALEVAERQLKDLQDRVNEAAKHLQNLSETKVITDREMEWLEKTIEKLGRDNVALTDRIPKEKARLVRAIKAANSLQEQVEGLASAVADLRRRVNALRDQPLITIIDRSTDGKRPLWVECSRNGCVVCRIPREGNDAGIAAKVKAFAGDDWVDQFVNWATAGRDVNPGTDKFVLLIRPDAVAGWEALMGRLKGKFTFGWDVWSKQHSLARE